MTSTYKQLLSDFKRGKEGENSVQRFLLEEFGISTKNVGEMQLGYDLEVVNLDGSKIGLDGGTYSKDKMIEKFIKTFGKTFEVKRDFTSDRTGNIYWECWSNKRLNNPGCQLTCKADTLVFVRSTEFVFVDRAKFLSWFFENTFMQTALSLGWQKKTFRGGNKRMMSAHNNPDVAGILIPVVDIKNSVSCFFVKKREIE